MNPPFLRLVQCWTARLTDLLLSSERKRRIRLKQTTLAILFTLSGIGGMQYVAWTGIAPWRFAAPWTLLTLVISGGFYAAIRSGWSERFADPALTMAQMIYAVACCASAYAIVGETRGAVFPLAMIVLMFGMFALKPRQVLAISLYAATLLGAVMGAMAQWHPQVYAPAIELVHFMMLATMLIAMSILAGQFSRMRVRLQQQKQDLANAFGKIHALATRDELTGLINRRRMNELIEKELQQSQRFHSPFCIAIVDLDHFKRINDEHGHGAGDEALRQFARKGSQMLRAADSLARWGGEEFLILMSHSRLSLAQEGVERIRQALEQMVVLAEVAAVRLTLSAGIVEHRPGESSETMIERADAALYSAKTQGRNRVVVG
ncbi:MAG: GGDEF domain-containing protein [Deltaproteobacteria bacterium]|nr:GGDEF domain-containing protein [Deltaproteobacteria bacterium]